jgi:branched-chain amino acid transport system substrate-binding protein
MASLPPVLFATLLRRYRQAAGLTQEELAERARLSVQAIGALERGDRRVPRKDTVDLLAEALSLSASDRAEFAAAARQRRQAAQTAQESALLADATPTVEDVVPVETAPLAATTLESSVDSAIHGVLQQIEAWSIPLTKTAHALSARLRAQRMRGLVSALMIGALLVGALLLKGETRVGAAPGSSLLCGGSIAIASDLPTSGADGANGGKAVENAVNLAVAQNQTLGGGYTLRIINYDEISPDTGLRDPVIGAGNVRRMVQNPCVVGMVGPFYSKLAPDEMVIAASARLVMVSPGATDPGLTLRPFADAQDEVFDAIHPPGKPNLFFRVIPNDAVQAVADANLTYNLGARTVYTVTNTGSYGQELVGGYSPAFEVRGGKVVGIDVLGFDPSVIPDIASRIVAAHPDAVFYGGVTSSGAGTLKAQLVALGYKGFFIGGDGIANPDFVTQAGATAAEGALASIGGRDPSTFTSGAGAHFLSDYAARYHSQNPAFYSAYAYDATMVLISAIQRVIGSGQPLARAGLIAQVQRTDYIGATGEITFDANGDIIQSVYSIYVVRQGKWTYFAQIPG